MCINRSSYGISVLTSYDVRGENNGRIWTPVIHAIHISLYGYDIHMYDIYIYIVIYRIIDHLLRWDAHGWLSELILFGSFWCQTSMFRRRDDSACLLSAALIHRTTPCALLTTHHVCILLLDRKTTHVCWMRRLNKKNAWKT